MGGWMGEKMFDISRPHFHIQFSTYLCISYMWICIGIDSHVTQATKKCHKHYCSPKEFCYLDNSDFFFSSNSIHKTPPQ